MPASSQLHVKGMAWVDEASILRHIQEPPFTYDWLAHHDGVVVLEGAMRLAGL